MPAEIDKEKYDELKELGGGSSDLLLELVDKYLENTPGLLADAKKALAEGDMKKLDYCVHTMKGSSLSLGLKPVSEKLVAMNQKTKAEDTADLEEELNSIDQDIEDIKKLRAQLS